MNNRFATFFERLLLIIVFCAVLGAFWLVMRQVQYEYSPLAYIQKVLSSRRGYTPASGSGYIKKALFAPDHDITAALLGLIGGEKESIRAAIYMLTDKTITQGLIDAHKRGINVQLVVDPSSVDSRFGRAPLAARAGIPVYVYKPYTSLSTSSAGRGSLMHNKFFIFSNTGNYRNVIVTGSFNATRSANTVNQENMLFLNDPDIFASYAEQFERLKERSRRY